MQKALATAPPRQHFGFLFQAHLAYSCCASQHLGLWQRSAPFLKARSTLVVMAPRADADVVPWKLSGKLPEDPNLLFSRIVPTTRAVTALCRLIERRTALRLHLRVVSRGRVGRCASPRIDASLARHSPSKAVSLLARPPRCGDSHALVNNSLRRTTRLLSATCVQCETQVYLSLSRSLAACSTLTLEALNAPPPKHVLARRACRSSMHWPLSLRSARHGTTGTGDYTIVIVHCSTSQLQPPASQGRDERSLFCRMPSLLTLVRCWAWITAQSSLLLAHGSRCRTGTVVHHSMRPFSGRFDSRSKSRRLSCVFDLGATSRVLQR